MKIKKGDNVVVISGKDRGFKGEILSVDQKKERVVVDGANLMKKHIKSQNKKEKGQRIEMPASMHVSNVKYYCAKCKKAVRIGFKKEEDGNKKRICKKGNHEI